ncbi:unnamed protein product [Rotaria sp. Silwood1]|nr:unnamed protein product [Rotaria sp. Silwood1]
MTFFPIRHYLLFDDPFDRFFGDQLDFFDPWYDFDTFPSALSIRPNAFRWINEPYRLTHSSSNKSQDRKSLTPTSRSPNAEKYRVQLNVAGFNPETIKTKVDGRKVIVEAKQEDRQSDGDYNIRELRKTYELPEHADSTRLASYVTPNNMLVIEVPIHNPKAERWVAQAKNDNQSLAQFGQYRDPLFDYVGFLTGSDFQPHEIKVSVKNNELIIQGERQHTDKNRSERFFFFKSTTLPPGTQIDQLQSSLTDDGQLKIEAPYIEQKEATKSIENQKK